MARRRTAIAGIQPLGARIVGIEHEWLPSMLQRIGHHFGVSAIDISRFCGLGHLDAPGRRRLGFAVTDDTAARIATALALPTDVLQTMVMSHLASIAVTRPGGRPAQSQNWTRGSGTRFCPECLRERPDVFYTYWRTWWSFLCLRHRMPLVAACPSCRREPLDATATEALVLAPGRCASRADDGSICSFPLSQSWQESALDETSWMVRAQRSIARHWGQTVSDEPSVPVATFRGVGIALLGTREPERIADLAGADQRDLAGLFNEEDRVGTTPPRDALAMSALMGAAYRLITEPESSVSNSLREITFSRPVRSTQPLDGPGSASYLLSSWPGIDALMGGRVLRALDGDLSTMQRLVWGTAASAENSEIALLVASARRSKVSTAMLLGDEVGMRSALLSNARRGVRTSELGEHPRDCLVPDLLWPHWANPLGIDNSTDAVALQRGLSDALRVAGNGTGGGAERIAGIGRKLRPSMLGSRGQTQSILRQLSELALVLDEELPPINYAARKLLPDDQLLRRDDWRAVAAAAGEDPGRSRRALNARRYAYLRATGTSTKELPKGLAFRPDRPDTADYSHFLTTMTAECQIAIDAYLDGWLARFEIPPERRDGVEQPPRPPVTWTPRRFKHAGADLGPELDDINLPRLHELVGNGETSLSILSHDLGRSQRHVRWALMVHPVPSNRLITPIDWVSRLQALPDSLPVYSAEAVRAEAAEEQRQLSETAAWVGAML